MTTWHAPGTSWTRIAASLLVFNLALFAIPARASEAADYAVLDSNRIGGAGGWDYLALDAAGARLYITRGDHVDVYDTSARKVIGTIPDTRGVHGVALNEPRKLGYTSNGKGNSVTVFSLDTLKRERDVPVPGENPDAILYEPATSAIFTFNGKSNDVSVIDATTYEVRAKISVPGKPEFAVSDGKGLVFANLETEPGGLVVIDAKRLAVKAVWPLTGCNSPTGLALDVLHQRLFSVCSNNVLAVTNATSGKPLARVRIGSGPDAAAYDATVGLVFASNGDGTLSIVRQESPDRYAAPVTLGTMRGARTMALDAKSHRIYLVTSDLGPAPAPTPEEPEPRPVRIPDTFTVHVAGPR